MLALLSTADHAQAPRPSNSNYWLENTCKKCSLRKLLKCVQGNIYKNDMARLLINVTNWKPPKRPSTAGGAGTPRCAPAGVAERLPGARGPGASAPAPVGLRQGDSRLRAEAATWPTHIALQLRQISNGAGQGSVNGDTTTKKSKGIRNSIF